MIRVIRQILQGCKQNQILSIHLLKIEKKNYGCKFYIYVTSWPLDWPLWCNFFTEGVVFHEVLRNAKKPKPKCVTVDSTIFQSLCLHSTRHWCQTTIEISFYNFYKSKNLKYSSSLQYFFQFALRDFHQNESWHISAIL